MIISYFKEIITETFKKLVLHHIVYDKRSLFFLSANEMQGHACYENILFSTQHKKSF